MLCLLLSTIEGHTSESHKPKPKDMTPQEKAKWLAEFWAQIAAGKTAQVQRSMNIRDEWEDVREEELVGPNARSNSDAWRIKPEPRRMWVCISPDKQAIHETEDKGIADELKAADYTVTEWIEVV
jgi:hypothetical protein